MHPLLAMARAKRRKHWAWSLLNAFASSSALAAMLTFLDSNGFDPVKDPFKIGLVSLAVFFEWVRNRDRA